MECSECRPEYLVGKVVLLETREMIQYSSSRIGINNIHENAWIIAGEVFERWLGREGFQWGGGEEEKANVLLRFGVYRWNKDSPHVGEYGNPQAFEVIMEVSD